MTDNIVPFPKHRDIETCKAVNDIKDMIESGQTKGHINLILTHDEEVIMMWNGDLTKEDMIRMCSLGVYEANHLDEE